MDSWLPIGIIVLLTIIIGGILIVKLIAKAIFNSYFAAKNKHKNDNFKKK